MVSMAENLSQLDRQRLDAALALWQQWCPRPASKPQLISRLGGESNVSFLVTDGTQQWALRLNAEGPSLGVNRQSERAAHSAAAQAGLAPSVVYCSAEVLVTPFIAGEKPSLTKLSAIGGLLRQVHELPIELPALKPLDYLQQNLLAARPYQGQADSKLIEDCAQWLAQHFPNEPITTVPCHNDCLLANLVSADSVLQLIDWEYAAVMDPAFELAVVCAGNTLNEAEKTQLFEGYGLEKIDTQFLQRLHYYQAYYGLLEILWWRRRGSPQKAELDCLLRFLDS
jgi:thiamine kinase-like enzyme